MLSQKWVEEYERLEKLCENNAITFHVQKDTFPIKFTVSPDRVETDQMSLIDDEKKNEISMEFIFGDELIINFIGDFRIDDETLNKLKNQAKKLHYIWLQIWFKGKDLRWDKYRFPKCFREPERVMVPDTNGYVMVYVPDTYRP